MCDIYRNRLNIANENIRGFKVSTEKFCTVVSGGDSFKARKLWGNEYTILNYSGMMAFANDTIRFDNVNSAVQDRFPGTYEFEILFVDKPIHKYHRKKLSHLKNLIYSHKYRDAMFWIIADTFQQIKNNNFKLTDPENFIQNKKDMFSNKTLIDIFYDNFEYTGDAKDKISIDYVFDILTVKFKDIDKKTMKIELQAQGIDESSKPFKFNGKTSRGYDGYKKINTCVISDNEII